MTPDPEHRDREVRLSKVRCLNCFTRFGVPARATEAECPECKAKWRISWVEADMPKIRGPVWDKYLGASQ